MNFEKYHSLENDFIILDQEIKPDVVTRLCNRHTGIGADGVLVIKDKKTVSIFNSNGNKAQMCLNGLRCVAHYMHTKYNFPKNFTLTMGNRSHKIKCATPLNKLLITTEIDYATYQENVTLTIFEEQFDCHIVTTGNPHCVIFKKISDGNLKQFGPALENHPHFPHKTNVEFVWLYKKLSEKNKIPTFSMLVYERDCGITRACSSGAVAVVHALSVLKKLSENQKLIISMPGGSLECSVKKNIISITAPAFPLFSGNISLR